MSSRGNSDRRGVSAVTTLRADLRMFSRTFHSRFLATKKRTAEATVSGFVLVWCWDRGGGERGEVLETYSLSR
ncbi:hypothetical protein IMZ48_46230 [Candidatus Bathyarchaeota archaeon]|nr:hypothetical protein [Candidatus Bathyarchaeota archaeon]